MQPYALLRPQGHSVSAPHAVPASAPHVVQARLPWAPCSRSVSVLKALRCRRAHPRSADGQAQVQPRANLVSLHATRSCIQRNETPKRRLRLRGRPPLPPGQEPCAAARLTRDARRQSIRPAAWQSTRPAARQPRLTPRDVISHTAKRDGQETSAPTERPPPSASPTVCKHDSRGASSPSFCLPRKQPDQAAGARPFSHHASLSLPPRNETHARRQSPNACAVNSHAARLCLFYSETRYR